MKGFVGALSFLTRVPVRSRTEPAIEAYVAWFPVVGALVGSLSGGVYAGSSFVWPSWLAAVIAVGVGVLATGAFHEDGLADTCDAFGAWDVEQARRILRDPRHGTYGVAGLALSLLVRIGCLASLGPVAGLVVLVAAHTIARGVVVVAMKMVPAASDEGLGASYAARVTPRAVVAATAVSLLVAAGLLSYWGLIAGVVAAACAALLARPAVGKVGGITGDVLGAIEQAAECGVLLVGAAVAQGAGGFVWWS